MKITRSMVVLLVTVLALVEKPSTAFAAATNPETVPALEQMSFDPLMYVTALLAAVTLCSVVVSTVFYLKYRTQTENVCRNMQCVNNPSALKDREGGDWFDYREFETPKEFSESCIKQSEMVMEEVIKHLITDADTQPEREPEPIIVSEPFYQPARRHEIRSDVTSPLPPISLVPEAKHAKRLYKQMPASLAQDVPEEIDLLLRKIS